jgi:UDP-N-acetylmuramoyl-tripeptide--D-alanyl-D-alanine ligase
VQPTLGFFLEALSSYKVRGDEPVISEVVVDSREAISGSLFVALLGERVDGHDYIADAFQRGAVAALVERKVDGVCSAVIDLTGGAGQSSVHWDGELPVCILVEDSVAAMQRAAAKWRAQFDDLKVIGITGSVGKSSTKELTHAVLSQRYRTFKSPGNRNSTLGLPAALFGLRPEHERAVLEMGMYSTGEIAQLCSMTQPDIGVVTIIGPVHLERAGTMETIVAAKTELVEALPKNGTAILNFDDDRVMGMAEHTRASVFTYGLDEKADVWADNIHSMGLGGVRFTLHHGGEALSLSVPMLGRHSVHTALRATAVGLVEKLSWEEIVAGLSEANSEQFRIEAVPGPGASTIIDDTYNSSPDSALAALNLLSELDGRRIAVLGDMLELGSAEHRSHRLIGRRVADVADILVAVGPRARIIADEAIKVGMPAESVFWVEEANEAVPLLEELITDEDMLLIKGSYGMRMDRIVAALGRDA